LAKSDHSILFVSLHSETDCNIAILINFICDDLATLFVNLVNFGSVTPEFKIGKDVHPSVSFFKINISDKLSHDPLDTNFSPHGRYLIVALFSNRSRDVGMATNFRVKIG